MNGSTVAPISVEEEERPRPTVGPITAIIPMNWPDGHAYFIEFDSSECEQGCYVAADELLDYRAVQVRILLTSGLLLRQPEAETGGERGWFDFLGSVMQAPQDLQTPARLRDYATYPVDPLPRGVPREKAKQC